MDQAPTKRVKLKGWLRGRLLEDPRAKQEWRQLWESSWDHLLATPASDLIDAESAGALADGLAQPELISELLHPVMTDLARALVAGMREDHEPIERFTPREARDALEALLGRPGLIHPDWVRAIFRGEAVEAIVNDTLYRVLKDFSTLLPRVLMKLSIMGRFGILGSAGALAERLIGEIEKLIEPEIRSFLSDSTGRVLESAAEMTIARMDDPAQIEFRTSFVDFVLSRSPAFLLVSADDESIDDMETIVELTARHLAEAPETREAMHASIERLMEYCADKTLGEVLGINETRIRPPTEALADVTWPILARTLSGPEAQRWLDALVDELIDEYERMSSA